MHLFGHLGDGNIHVNYRAPKSVSRDDFLKEFKPLERKVLDKVIKLGGSISAEHGIGLLKKDLFKEASTQKEIDLMRKLKKVFDPTGDNESGEDL